MDGRREGEGEGKVLAHITIVCHDDDHDDDDYERVRRAPGVKGGRGRAGWQGCYYSWLRPLG